MEQTKLRSFRRDGWTAKRQLTFLSELARSGRITKAARAAGMSRESAYRLRARDPDGLFAAAWDRALKGHKSVNFAAARKRRARRENGGIASKSIKGHNLYDPLCPRAPSTSS